MEDRIFEFDIVQTASPKLAEAYAYLKQLETAAEVSENDDAERLEERLGAVAGLTARIKACLCEYLGIEAGEEPEAETAAGKVFAVLSEVADLAFVRENALTAGDLADRLRSADLSASRLPFMIAGLDAGEDLSEN